jgi:hypothetical protein
MHGVYFFIKETHLNRAYCDVGWGNGYVLLPKEHPWFGKHYDDIPVAVHGGLTFSDKIDMKWVTNTKGQVCEEIETLKEDDFNDLWCIGFDCAHSGDDLNTCPKEYVWRQAELLKDQCMGEDNPALKRWVRKYKILSLETKLKKCVGQENQE